MNEAQIALESGDEYPYELETGDTTPPTDWAHRAARGVMADLSDRCGIKHELGKVAMDVRKDMVSALADIIRSAGGQSPWIKATDINRPGGWYWTRLGSDDESCPQVVFIAIENDGDSAPDFRVECVGEDGGTAKRLKQWAEGGWEFMEILNPG